MFLEAMGYTFLVRNSQKLLNNCYTAAKVIENFEINFYYSFFKVLYFKF